MAAGRAAPGCRSRQWRVGCRGPTCENQRRKTEIRSAPAAEQKHAALGGVLADQGRGCPDLFHLEWRGLVKLIDPVTEQQVCVATPAVFRLAARVVPRKIIAWQRDRLSSRDVT